MAPFAGGNRHRGHTGHRATRPRDEGGEVDAAARLLDSGISLRRSVWSLPNGGRTLEFQDETAVRHMSKVHIR